MTIEVYLTFEPESLDQWEWIRDRLEASATEASTFDVYGVPDEWQ